MGCRQAIPSCFLGSADAVSLAVVGMWLPVSIVATIMRSKPPYSFLKSSTEPPEHGLRVV